jgi:hypothetical protein
MRVRNPEEERGGGCPYDPRDSGSKEFKAARVTKEKAARIAGGLLEKCSTDSN